MRLPKQIQNSQSGQILIIFLLILVIGLAITLSIASRTVTDVRQTTTSDESNRAYFAAESGVENALKKIEETPSFTGAASVDLSSVNRANAAVNVASLNVTGVAFEFPSPIAKDDVAQVNLLNDFNDIQTAGNGVPGHLGTLSVKRTNGLTVYWGSTTKPNAAIEVSIVTCDSGSATTCSASPNFHIYKWTFDKNAVANGNGFCGTVTTLAGGVDTTIGTARPFRYSATFNFTSRAASDCAINDLFGTANDQPVMARIRVLYDGPVPVAVKTTSSDLPSQGVIITSTGSTTSGVTRKLTVTRLYPALPAIFDYVLYNGSSSQALTKP